MAIRDDAWRHPRGIEAKGSNARRVAFIVRRIVFVAQGEAFALWVERRLALAAHSWTHCQRQHGRSSPTRVRLSVFPPRVPVYDEPSKGGQRLALGGSPGIETCASPRFEPRRGGSTLIRTRMGGGQFTLATRGSPLRAPYPTSPPFPVRVACSRARLELGRWVGSTRASSPRPVSPPLGAIRVFCDSPRLATVPCMFLQPLLKCISSCFGFHPASHRFDAGVETHGHPPVEPDVDATHVRSSGPVFIASTISVRWLAA
jgi:hypothetical protein